MDPMRRGVEFEVVELEPRRLVALRRDGPLEDLDEAFGRLAAWADECGLSGPRTEWIALYDRTVGLSRDALVRCDACIPAPDAFVGNDELRLLPRAMGGRFVLGTYQGPRRLLDEAWVRLERDVVHSGIEVAFAPGWERYGGPGQATELLLPVM